MSSTDVSRHALVLAESLLAGPAYGVLKHMIRAPEPLDADETWERITRKRGPVARWLRLRYPPTPLVRLLLSRWLNMPHIVGIADYYDVSNDFFKLCFDRDYIFGSCGDFEHPDESLEQAQARKAAFIYELLDPRPEHEILDLGCGWGSMLKYLCERLGGHRGLHGYTLSKEQLAYIRTTYGFDVSLTDFATTDYPAQRYDRIVSIGAWEHLRPEDIGPLLAKLHHTLKPDGCMVLHFFCRPNEQLHSSVLAAQLYFPGSIASPYSFHRDAFERAGFRITHRSIHDYRPTLRAWFNNLVANRDEAIALVGVRTYNRFLTFFAVSWRYFDDGLGMLVRWRLEKGGSVAQRMLPRAL